MSLKKAKKTNENKGLYLVRVEGLEPPRLAALVPKTSASTNSATPARRRHYRKRAKLQGPARGVSARTRRVAPDGAMRVPTIVPQSVPALSPRGSCAGRVGEVS